MSNATMTGQLDRVGDVLQLKAQIVGRFYKDLNRLGQRSNATEIPSYYKPERWISSGTSAANPPGIPSGGLSACIDLDGRTLKDVLANPETGPRLLGAKRFAAHRGTLRVLIKLLDAGVPIPVHVHADDAFVANRPEVYPNETFGKDEAYHFLEAPKGGCPYTHVGLHAGVDARTLIAAMRRSTDHVVELLPGALQTYGEGYYVAAGTLHRPGTALTLEIQQPSDVYALFQTDFGGEPVPEAVRCPGFKSIEEAAEQVVNWRANLQPGLLESVHLRPTVVDSYAGVSGAKVEWVFPPRMTDKFSGARLTVQTSLTFKAEDPFVLYVWSGKGTLQGKAIDGAEGAVGNADEFFVGQDAARRGVELKATGDAPLVAFAMFAAKV